MNTSEKPILFSSEMVRAILTGYKTQTRRVVTQAEKFHYHPTDEGIDILWALGDIRCPYDVDQLWVRETWRIVGWQDGEPFLLEYKDGTRLEEPGDSSDYDEDKYIQFTIDCSNDMERAGVRLDVENNQYLYEEYGSIPTRWRPSIFMPRWASRIQLKVNRVSMRRLQDISAIDAMREGIELANHPINKKTIEALGNGSSTGLAAIEDFICLWDRINAKRGYVWDANPWVWVVEFTHSKPSCPGIRRT